MPLNPEATYVHLSSDGTSQTAPGGEAFWSLPPEAMSAFDQGWLISEFVCTEDWANWEMHPQGDEFVYLLSGDVELLLDLPTGLTTLRLRGRGAHIVPRGVWHTARVFAPSRMFFVTRGEGTQHRPASGLRQPPLPVTPTQVHLREITSNTVRAVVRLSVADSQKGFVAPNAVSLAQALFAPEAWYRAIYRGDELVGFVMLEDESLRTPPPARPGIGVWRLMIDERFQRQGIGRAALQLVIEHARTKGLFDRLVLSYVPGPGCPEPFYLGLGFQHTGRVDEGEIVLELPLQPEQPAPG